jgi:hypothetical protein
LVDLRDGHPLVLFAIAVAPTLDWTAVRRELMTFGGLPVLLVALVLPACCGPM